MTNVLTLQITMLLLIFIGALVKKIKIVSPTGQKNINDLVKIGRASCRERV